MAVRLRLDDLTELQVVEGLAMLTDRQQAVIDARRRGLTYRAIGQTLGVDHKSVMATEQTAIGVVSRA